MNDATKVAKLTVSLCRPILEYADVVYNRLPRTGIHDIELGQNSAISFIISHLKLQLQYLDDRRKNNRLCFLTKILQNEDQHHTLSTVYNDIARDRQLGTVTTHAAARREPISISTKNSFFHTSFLPKTICEMCGENN